MDDKHPIIVELSGSEAELIGFKKKVPDKLWVAMCTLMDNLDHKAPEGISIILTINGLFITPGTDPFEFSKKKR